MSSGVRVKQRACEGDGEESAEENEELRELLLLVVVRGRRHFGIIWMLKNTVVCLSFSICEEKEEGGESEVESKVSFFFAILTL